MRRQREEEPTECTGERETKRHRISEDCDPTVDSVSSNPHILQVLQANCNYESRTDIEFTRILDPDMPRNKYRQRHGEEKTVLHWGQRKLFLAELEFLTLYSSSGDTIVYAGAAPGTHIRYLCELFPALHFVLVDPAPFSGRLRDVSRCKIRQEMFTDEVAKEFSAVPGVLFICDIRSCDSVDMGQIEEKVAEDMSAQQRWHDIIQPKKSMLKFRLPYAPGTTEYLEGDVHLQAFGPITSTETRLIPYGHTRTLWDNTKYEEQMFYFNTVTRVARYPHKVPVGRAGDGMDYCYDCRAEVHILTQYLQKTYPDLKDEKLWKYVSSMSRRCSHECGVRRTLASPNYDKDVKTEGIRKRQWINGKPAYM